MREKEFKTMQEDLQYHKDKHEHYRARCDVQEKVKASPAILQWTASMTKNGSEPQIPRWSFYADPN